MHAVWRCEESFLCNHRGGGHSGNVLHVRKYATPFVLRKQNVSCDLATLSDFPESKNASCYVVRVELATLFGTRAGNFPVARSTTYRLRTTCSKFPFSSFPPPPPSPQHTCGANSLTAAAWFLKTRRVAPRKIQQTFLVDYALISIFSGKLLFAQYFQKQYEHVEGWRMAEGSLS